MNILVYQPLSVLTLLATELPFAEALQVHRRLAHYRMLVNFLIPCKLADPLEFFICSR
jgi:hypothetical protein